MTSFANVSRRLFYAEFADKESCFLATLEVVLSQWREQLPMGFASHGGELRGEPQRVVRVALDVLFEQISVDPLGARLLFVEAAAPGPAAQAWVAEVAAELRTLTMTLLGGTDGDPVVSPSVAGGIIGGVIENDRCPHRGRLGR
jgi:AcrR family transcriptional regulator